MNRMLVAGLIPLVLSYGPQSAAERDVSSLPEIRFNDNLTSAGTLHEGVLSVRLSVQRGSWHLLGPDEVGGEVLAFAEEGRPPEIPGPMIRVPLGTDVRVAVSNPLAVPLVVHGLGARRVVEMDSLVVPPSSQREIRFTANSEGTYYYWGTTTGATLDERRYEDSQLSGALIVDPVGDGAAPNERVMVVGAWSAGRTDEGDPDFGRSFLVINGRPWPLTERLVYELGDSIRWRVINATGRTHPMHLHGFFFRVDARGDLARDTIYWPSERRMAVTELMRPGTTMSVAWSPDRPGGWIFHCHLNWHVIPNASLGPHRESGEERELHLIRGHHEGNPHNHAVEGMGGLVMGIYVRPPEGWVPSEPKRRELRLFINSDSATGDDRRRFGYVLQTGDEQPPQDSIRVPGSPIILWKGEPTSITVINRSPEASQVHWHGLEIESYFDGVAGAGGYPNRLTPAILAGDSFEIRITPPRAGSFMYHTHIDDIRQQSSGLYGAFIVLEEDEEWEPHTDRVFLLSHSREFEVLLNGTTEPVPLTFRAGASYRIRLMNITLHEGRSRFRLVRDDVPVQWHPLAKDGWDLLAHQTSPVRADQTVSIGETFDFEYTPQAPGELHLEVRTRRGQLQIDQLIRVEE